VRLPRVQGALLMARAEPDIASALGDLAGLDLAGAVRALAAGDLRAARDELERARATTRTALNTLALCF
jgi:hypothetical protein